VTDVDLSPLNPLARVIAEAVRTTPVRFGPGGTDDLISEITIRVAAYMGRVVATDPVTQQPRPTTTRWTVEQFRTSGKWMPWVGRDDRAEALQEAAEMRADRLDIPVRVVRETTTYAVEPDGLILQHPNHS